MVISRVEIELGHHGGNDNDNLPVTKGDFVQYGIYHHSIAPAVREAEALGFLRVKRGRGGNAEHRTPSKFGLTYAYHRSAKRSPPTDEWRQIKTVEEAEAIAKAARKVKDVRAVSLGKSGAKKQKRKTKAGAGLQHVSGMETSTENDISRCWKPAPQVQGWKPAPLSIFREGTATEASAEPAPLHGIGHNQGPPLGSAAVGATPTLAARGAAQTDEERIAEANKQRQANQDRYKEV